MERVRVVVFGCLLALGLLFCPSAAYASDGFLGGLQDLVGVREVDEPTSYETDYLKDYEPNLNAGQNEIRTTTVSDLDEDATTVDYVNATAESFNSVPIAGTNGVTFLGAVQRFIGASSSILSDRQLQLWVLPAIGIVFLWWGVRKSIRMIFAAFRKGSASV